MSKVLINLDCFVEVLDCFIVRPFAIMHFANFDKNLFGCVAFLHALRVLVEGFNVLILVCILQMQPIDVALYFENLCRFELLVVFGDLVDKLLRSLDVLLDPCLELGEAKGCIEVIWVFFENFFAFSLVPCLPVAFLVLQFFLLHLFFFVFFLLCKSLLFKFFLFGLQL